MRNGEPNVYGTLGIIYNGYVTQQWSRVQMFLVFNTIALPIVLGTGQTEAAKLAISLVGFVMHVILLVATWRANGWIKLYASRLAELENLDYDNIDDVNTVRVRFFSSQAFRRRRRSWGASRWLFGAAALLLTAVWLYESIALGHRYLFL